jgi:hypothetical protein
LAEALANTFKGRGTKLPDRKPLVFTAEFVTNPDKQKQWAAFCEKNRSYVEESTLQDVCKELERFLTPVLEALASNTKFARKWTREMRWH